MKINPSASQTITVDTRVHERHPEIRDEDAIAAWRGCLHSARRPDSAFDDFVAIGFDDKGCIIELIATLTADGSWHIYHAFTPPTKKVMMELGLM